MEPKLDLPILVVEDEPAIRESLAFALNRGGFRAILSADLEEARQALGREPLRLVLLDLMLPDGSGFALLEELRQNDTKLPVIVLSSRSQEQDRVRALESGADDYVTKPFSPREVVARIRAVLRRSGEPKLGEGKAAEGKAAEAKSGAMSGLRLDCPKRRAFCLAQELDLTRVEFDLLALLALTPGHVFTRPVIIDRVWGSGFALSDRTIDSHIKALRKKLVAAGASPDWIETVRGVGYRYQEEAPPL